MTTIEPFPLSEPDRAALLAEWLHFSKPVPAWHIVRGCYACALLGSVGGVVAGLLLFVRNAPDAVAATTVFGGFLLGMNCSVRGNRRNWEQANNDRARYAAHLAQVLQEGKPVLFAAPRLELAEAHCAIYRRGKGA